MRAIVTGGGGFIGGHLIEALLRNGDEVVCIEQPGVDSWVRQLPITYLPIGIENEDTLSHHFRDADVVFHLAALTAARTPARFYQVNVDGTGTVLRAAERQGSRVPRVVLISSLAALGPCRNGELLSPDSIPCPLTHYGQSKLLAEAVAHTYRNRVPVTVLRFPSVYGPRERVVLTIFRMIQHGLAVSVGDWNKEFSLLYVRDAVQGLLAAGAMPGAIGRTYCVAHPEKVTWASFAGSIASALGRKPFHLRIPRPIAWAVAVGMEMAARCRGRAADLSRERLREITQRRWVCDSSRATNELGFVAAYASAQGALETANWYRKAAWL